MGSYEISFGITLDEDEINELKKVNRKGAKKPINKIVTAWKTMKINQANR